MNPFTPKIDHNLNSPHKINTPTKMVSIRTRENLNWTIIFCPKRNQLGEFFFRTSEFMS